MFKSVKPAILPVNRTLKWMYYFIIYIQKNLLLNQNSFYFWVQGFLYFCVIRPGIPAIFD